MTCENPSRKGRGKGGRMPCLLIVKQEAEDGARNGLKPFSHRLGQKYSNSRVVSTELAHLSREINIKHEHEVGKLCDRPE